MPFFLPRMSPWHILIFRESCCTTIGERYTSWNHV